MKNIYRDSASVIRTSMMYQEQASFAVPANLSPLSVSVMEHFCLHHASKANLIIFGLLNTVKDNMTTFDRIDAVDSIIPEGEKILWVSHALSLVEVNVPISTSSTTYITDIAAIFAKIYKEKAAVHPLPSEPLKVVYNANLTTPVEPAPLRTVQAEDLGTTTTEPVASKEGLMVVDPSELSDMSEDQFQVELKKMLGLFASHAKSKGSKDVLDFVHSTFDREKVISVLGKALVDGQVDKPVIEILLASEMGDAVRSMTGVNMFNPDSVSDVLRVVLSFTRSDRDTSSIAEEELLKLNYTSAEMGVIQTLMSKEAVERLIGIDPEATKYLDTLGLKYEAPQTQTTPVESVADAIDKSGKDTGAFAKPEGGKGNNHQVGKRNAQVPAQPVTRERSKA